jgi:hypothetical protein
MGNLLCVVKGALDITLSGPVTIIFKIMKWFYFTLIPFVLMYIGIPMFLLGVILAVSFAGGTILFIIVFFLVMFYFIKGTLFTSNAKIFK